MGDSTPFPTPAVIARAEKLTRERFIYEGEPIEEALSPGSARRRALDAALAEVEQGAKQPSIEWRREFSLLLGLERVLSEDEPRLADGTVLSAHQVDALSGTLTALLAEAQRTAANGNTLEGAGGAAACALQGVAVRGGALGLCEQGGERAGEGIDLVGGEDGAVGELRLVLGEHTLEAEQQRELPSPGGRGVLGAFVELGERLLEREPAGLSLIHI